MTSLGIDVTGTGDDTSYTFTPAQQLASRTQANTAYARPGFVAVNRSYATNGLNQYTSAGPATFTYDGNGNLKFLFCLPPARALAARRHRRVHL